MSIFRLGAAALVAAALVTASSSAASAATLDQPLVTAADLVSSDGAGCAQPAVHLGDGDLDVQARSESDTSLSLSGTPGESGASTECVVQVHLQFDQPARVRPEQYVMSGFVGTASGTSSMHWFESSFDGTTWSGQRNSFAAGFSGPFAQGGGSWFDPWSDCATEADVSFRVGLALSAPDGLTAGDHADLDSPRGADAILDTQSCS